ncbi:hypothetical protein P153DRAFT_220274 [Dothidotthia symphoricarpi CBS 119687]|uniref:Uncharacterized protein n=1 Tax=Dothidotthia symphoricarpi CBS 119687 TaxID=1392245 RepID=A0A6A6AFG6_9PLEO|nr:uncharacterized protein P153DRAFT_220274 [Dothidotthia symphoricarpi CBS 119687]KAF2130530.1 hypothetical protein P153DRAFT_220274 [Dothidotthia symphoricarpi CBS 119687]
MYMPVRMPVRTWEESQRWRNIIFGCGITTTFWYRNVLLCFALLWSSIFETGHRYVTWDHDVLKSRAHESGVAVHVLLFWYERHSQVNKCTRDIASCQCYTKDPSSDTRVGKRSGPFQTPCDCPCCSTSHMYTVRLTRFVVVGDGRGWRGARTRGSSQERDRFEGSIYPRHPHFQWRGFIFFMSHVMAVKYRQSRSHLPLLPLSIVPSCHASCILSPPFSFL